MNFGGSSVAQDSLELEWHLDVYRLVKQTLLLFESLIPLHFGDSRSSLMVLYHDPDFDFVLVSLVELYCLLREPLVLVVACVAFPCS